MFGTQFYPTPKLLIEKMISGLNFEIIKSILEPSAGKGDILDALRAFQDEQNENRWSNNRLDFRLAAGEIDPNLRAILKSKGYQLVSNDFLSFNTYERYDLIIMNPPFADGAKHLLKALSMQKKGGSIVCLLNAETLRNPYTNERKELLKQLGETTQHTIEYLSSEFESAERKTNVEVALVKVYNEARHTSYFQNELEKAQKVKENEQKVLGFEVAENDYISVFVKQFEIETGAGVRLIEEYEALKPLIQDKFIEKDENGEPLIRYNSVDSTLQLIQRRSGSSYQEDITINGFLEATRLKYWRALFESSQFTDKLTWNLASELRSKVNEYAVYDFTYANIKDLQIEMTQNLYKGLEDTLIEEFEELSSKYSFEEFSSNIHYYSGWKSNKAYFVNKKVVSVKGGWGDGWGRTRNDFKTGREYNDLKGFKYLKNLDKALSYLDDHKEKRQDMESLFEQAKYSMETSNVPFNYFKVTFYKKGTIHITFTDLEILKKFNIFVGQRKNWLPPVYGKKGYSDMSEEEKQIIDEFEGEKSYNEVYRNSDKYIVETSTLLAIDTAV